MQTNKLAFTTDLEKAQIALMEARLYSIKVVKKILEQYEYDLDQGFIDRHSRAMNNVFRCAETYEKLCRNLQTDILGAEIVNQHTPTQVEFVGTPAVKIIPDKN